MLYFPELELAFMHVPKNAGKSVRRALEAVGPASCTALAADLGRTEDDARAILEGSGEEIGGLGPLKPEHLPLAVLAEHFPHCLAQITHARSCMLVRPPRDRFFSALLQRMREFGDQTALRSDDPAVAREAHRVCSWLDGRGPFHEIDYIHFSRQVDYARLDGKRIVDALFPMNRTDALAAWIRTETGIQVNIAHDHARREPKSWAGALQPGFRFVGRKLLPAPFKRAIYPLWMKSAVFANASEGYERVRLDPEIETFIADYYAADAELYSEAQAFVAALDLTLAAAA